MELRSVQPEDLDALRAFLSEMGWRSRVNDPERFRKMFDGAVRSVILLDANRVIGFGRALCDNVSNGYLSMVAVAPHYRKRGLGRQIIERLMGDDPNITWVLRSGRGSDGFWEKMGFRRSKIAWERVRAEIDVTDYDAAD